MSKSEPAKPKLKPPIKVTCTCGAVFEVIRIQHNLNEPFCPECGATPLVLKKATKPHSQ